MSQTQTLPYGGQEIAALRAIGKRPADMVLLSLIGPLREPQNPVVIANPNRRYDWRFLVGLDVLVVVRSTIRPEAVRRLMTALLDAGVEYLGLWFGDRQDGRHVAWGTYRPRHLAMTSMFPYDKRQFSGIGESGAHH